jgi:hypothetical protein
MIFSTLSVLQMQILTDIVVAYLKPLFQLQRSESVECGGELMTITVTVVIRLEVFKYFIVAFPPP